MDNFGFLKVAAAVPHVRVGDCDFNTERIAAMAEEAAQRGVEIVAFPELAVTAYTCADLLLLPALLDAADEALARLVKATRKLPLVIIAGAPLRHGSTLYNCAVVFTQGRVLGVVPKTYIPDYTEFYENRWFASGAGISEETISVAEQSADFGADLTFGINGTEFGVEICEDLWTAIPPSSHLALNGAKVIFNLSASPNRWASTPTCVSSWPSSRPAPSRDTSTARQASANRPPIWCSPATASSPKTAGYSANRDASGSKSSSSWPISTFSGWNSNAAATPRFA